MQLFEGALLHVYNRGNNKQQIFFNEQNYSMFINKAKRQIAGVSDILAYCLMPNHFHFLIHANETSCKSRKVGSLVSNELQNTFRILQSSYANAINKELGRTGSVFQQKTKFKILNEGNGIATSLRNNYPEACFHYIHQNPIKAGLVSKMEHWKYSSFGEYLSSDIGLCNKPVSLRLLDLDIRSFYETSYSVIKDGTLSGIKFKEDC